MEWDHTPTHGQSQQFPSLCCSAPQARLSQVLLRVFSRSCVPAGFSQPSREHSLGQCSQRQPSPGHCDPSSAEALQGERVPCQLPKSGSSSGTPPVKPKIIPGAPPRLLEQPRLPRGPHVPCRGPPLCCRPSDAEAVTAISLLISNLSAPKHAWTDISADNWGGQHRAAPVRGGVTARGSQGEGQGTKCHGILDRRKSSGHKSAPGHCCLRVFWPCLGIRFGGAAQQPPKPSRVV